MPGGDPGRVGDEHVAGRMLSGPTCLMNSFTVTGSVPMNEGMLSVFWASDCPAASVSTQAKSLNSLTRVENDVRLSALAASSTAEIVRRQRISSVTASKGWLSRADCVWDMIGYQAELAGAVNADFHVDWSWEKLESWRRRIVE